MVEAGLFLVIFGSLLWVGATVFILWFMRGLLLQQLEMTRDVLARVKAPEKVPLDPNKIRVVPPDVQPILNEAQMYQEAGIPLGGGPWMGG